MYNHIYWDKEFELLVRCSIFHFITNLIHHVVCTLYDTNKQRLKSRCKIHLLNLSRDTMLNIILAEFRFWYAIWQWFFISTHWFPFREVLNTPSHKLHNKIFYIFTYSHSCQAWKSELFMQYRDNNFFYSCYVKADFYSLFNWSVIFLSSALIIGITLGFSWNLLM